MIDTSRIYPCNLHPQEDGIAKEWHRRICQKERETETVVIT